jgi:predicted GNAT family acetyltransferase
MAGPTKMIIDHTEVQGSLQGQGVGRKLLNDLIYFARANDIKVIPLCPYAKSVFDKDLSIRDVLL